MEKQQCGIVTEVRQKQQKRLGYTDCAVLIKMMTNEKGHFLVFFLFMLYSTQAPVCLCEKIYKDLQIKKTSILAQCPILLIIWTISLLGFKSK
jgi:hypothetical protein